MVLDRTIAHNYYNVERKAELRQRVVAQIKNLTKTNQRLPLAQASGYVEVLIWE